MSAESAKRTQVSPAQMYEQFLVPAMFLPFVTDLIERIAPQAGERVLDVACGTGAVTRHLPPLVGTGGSVAGLDVSPDMIAVARSIPASPGASISWGDCSAEALTVENETFDVVLCQHGLQFFGDRQAALREMCRALVPGGRVGITVWQRLEHQPLYHAFAEALERHIGETTIDVPFSLGDAEAFQSLLDDAGFDKVSVNSATRTVRFPFSEQFVSMMALSAAAVLPAYKAMSDAERRSLVNAIASDVDPTLQAHRDGDEIASPMSAHIAIGHKPALDA